MTDAPQPAVAAPPADRAPRPWTADVVMSVSSDGATVLMKFDAPVDALEMQPFRAILLARALLKHAGAAKAHIREAAP